MPKGAGYATPKRGATGLPYANQPAPVTPAPKPLYGGANIDFSQVEGMADLEPPKKKGK